MNSLKVSIIGMGYIGLPTAAVISKNKIRTHGVDIDKKIVNTIKKGNIHITEPGLKNMVSKAVKDGYLTASLRPVESDIFIITVPTPLNSKKLPDLSYVKEAAKSIAPYLTKGNLIILESTSPVGTTKSISKIIKSLRSDLTFPHEVLKKPDINISYCPERVIPGQTLKELVINDRVIGGMTKSCSSKASKFYSIFVKGKCHQTNAETAELSKLAENSFRDINIAFANELSMICDDNKIDPWELIKIANRHPRVNILQPGPGVGGHCIAVDPWFIVAHSKKAKLIKQAREVNLSKTKFVIKKIRKAVKNISKEKNLKPSQVKIAIFGIAFKANIDDLRESPAFDITEDIVKNFDSSLLIVEPNIKKLPISLEGNSRLVSSDMAIRNCHIAIGLVDHKEFLKYKKIDFYDIDLIDCKGIWD